MHPSSATQNLAVWRVLIAAACLAMLVGTPLPHLDSDAGSLVTNR